MKKVVSAAVVARVKAETTQVVFMDCGQVATDPTVSFIWSLSGKASWYGGRKEVLTVDVRTPQSRTFFRERYTVNDYQVDEIAISDFGFSD